MTRDTADDLAPAPGAGGTPPDSAVPDSAARFRTIFDHARMGIAFADANGRLLDVNESFARFVGYRRAECAGLNFADLTHPEDLDTEIVFFREIQAGTRHDYRLEKRYRTRDGRLVWGDLTVTAIRDAAGRPINFVGLIDDITERQASRTEYRAIIDTTMDGFWINDLQGRFLDVNAAYCELIGYGREELLTMTIPDLEVVESPEDTRAHIETIVATGSDRFETRHRRRDGRILDVEVSVNYLPFDRGRLVVFVRDITERKRVEAELVAARQAAEAASRAKSRFLANMSHEIRTPMNAILGLTQAALESELDAEQRHLLQQVHRSSSLLLRLLNDILDYSRIEAGRIQIENHPFSPAQLVRETAALFGARLAEKGLALDLDLGPEVPEQVLGDALRLSQTLNNLVDNAIKFTERGRVAIAMRARAGTAPDPADPDRPLTLEFMVGDTGIGLTEDQRAALFQPFSQADSSIGRRHGGTGLGLAISQQLVQLMGGAIRIESEAGLGSTFSFTVRLGRPPTPIPATSGDPPAARPSPSDPSPAPGQSQVPRLDALIPFLERCEVLPDETLRELRAAAAGAPPDSPLARLLDRLDHFDHQGALQILRQGSAPPEPKSSAYLGDPSP